MSNLSSINCFDTHGNGQTDPVIFTSQTHTTQQRVYKTTDTPVYQNYETSSVFYNPYPEIYTSSRTDAFFAKFRDFFQKI